MARRIAGVLAAAIFAQAVAAETDTADALSWSQDPDSIIRVDSSDAGTATNFYSFSRIIRTSGGTGPVLMLNCQAMSTGSNSLNAAILLDPANTYEQNPSERLHLLSLTGTLTINGQQQKERFKYHPESSKIIPYDKAVSKRLFNAVVTGASVQLKVKGKTYDLEIPGKDQVFVAFAKTCPMTNGGTFDSAIFEEAKAQEDAE